MTPSELYAKMLEAEGLIVETKPDGRLHFKYEGDNYQLLTYADDRQYVGVSASYQIPVGVRSSNAVAEAHDFTRKSKVAKVYVLPKRAVTIATEVFVKEPEQLDTVLPRLIRVVQDVTAGYFARLATHAPISTRR